MSCCSTPRWWGHHTTFAPALPPSPTIARSRSPSAPASSSTRPGWSSPTSASPASSCAMARRSVLTEIAGRLRQLRGLMATGLTLDELSALSAPWFLDRAYVDTYTAAIFANNRLLAQSIGSEFGRLRPALPSLAVDARRRCPVLRPSTPRRIARPLPASGRDRRAAERAARPAIDQGRVVRVPRPSLRVDRASTPTGRSLPARRHGLARRP